MNDQTMDIQTRIGIIKEIRRDAANRMRNGRKDTRDEQIAYLLGFIDGRVLPMTF